MNVGELFVNLGVKGTDKTLNAFVQVKSGLSGIASTSLEAKAAIAGMLYGIEQLMSSSAQLGTNLVNFNALTGENIEKLSRLGNAAKLGGSSLEELESSMQNIQKIMTQFQSIGQMPQGAQLFFGKTNFDREKAGDLDYVLDKLREFSKMKEFPGLRNLVANQMGISGNLLAAMNRGFLDPDKLSRMPHINESQARALDRVRQQMSMIEISWQKTFANLTSQNGGQFMTNMTNLSTSLQSLVMALNELSNTMHLLEGVRLIFDGWTQTFKATTEAIKTINDLNDPNKKVGAQQKVSEFLDAIPGALKLMLLDANKNSDRVTGIDKLNLNVNVDKNGNVDADLNGKKVPSNPGIPRSLVK